MNEYAIGRASADLRDAILKCMGIDPPIRLRGPRQRARPKPPVRKAPVSYRVDRCERIQAIIQLVADHYGIDVALLTGKRGPVEVSNARQVAMFLSREFTGHSFPRIGWMFNRDHTTVMHACEEVARRISDPDYACDIEELRDEILPMALAA